MFILWSNFLIVFHVLTTKTTARHINIIQGGVTLFRVTPTIVPNNIIGIRTRAIFKSTENGISVWIFILKTHNK